MSQRIRLDERATDIFENLGHYQAKPETAEQARRIYEAVRDAEYVMDCRDTVIKDRHAATPHPATVSDFQSTTLVRGDG